MQTTYDKFPEVTVQGYDDQAWQGWESIEATLNLRASASSRTVLVVDCYPGVRLDELEQRLLPSLNATRVLNVESARRDQQALHDLLARNLTDDRVFGVLSCHHLEEFFNADKLQQLRQQVDAVTEGLIVIYGPGAALVHPGDVLVYADMPRWEIQQRMRHDGLGNWGADNQDEDILRRYKRAFFIEWRVFDRHKTPLLKRADYLLDTTQKEAPTLVSGEALRAGLRQTTTRPFRVAPFFDPGVWGGQWMKQQFDLDPSAPNYAWCFDCVPEENSLLLRFGQVRIEIPSQNLVLLHPRALLGEKVHARFGAEFPIRFDFLDTIGGQNLSFQVHPVTEYIQQQFGMHYTQDESYYILEAQPHAVVYLGTKTGIEPQAMLDDLKAAACGEKTFDDARFVNQIPARKHDHFLIPAGTVHCSGSGTMVLEISATPYIFTFKLWDWGRLGLDGLPRPVHLEHGEQVIDWQRDTRWVADNLVNQVEPVAEGEGWREERTGMHEREFIETRRHWFTAPVTHHTQGGVNVLNLVEGDEAIVDSPSGAFAPFVVHYAETFIIPAAVGEYRISPSGKGSGQPLATIKAWVRG
ncbi:TPA: class I mannose-6-phosphate isomerase [Raoultella ornithinolytica]|jgi:mannose-6-phosphate isomerase class I|uniref:class I mannose-6-phosphate isomerase n=1 Tax=Raoultella ornithinolytica TaxID=54291 RepID=UPI00084A2219|nr:class I mannose-6-phosphate isomerase [Raoultella ornithinolytica]AOO57595.1 mannose-6-phosphate isomerase [Raoultella ornithinolytica]WKL83181.1 class I mannose-6-phosphate isomerase [Raoultella ornithinolytica]HDG9787843.1 class I mannose-6-phosphate isomerase [Raoultella ornithinolytica]HDG9798823.1 class I mannose-6-phosphate isomerase [Raoultella ornithinolytica]HDG9803357.1 class I mannose-6-phosphate isomerase [Raoultella ornithinolytica]